MQHDFMQNYLQYSKRIAIFGIVQWGTIAVISLILVLLSSYLHIFVDEWAARVVNNVVTCSSALSIAVCSGYYAHSAYDNNLKKRVTNMLDAETPEPSPKKTTYNG